MLNTIFLSGASAIKAQRQTFQNACAELAMLIDNPDVKAQLVAASVAGSGKSNTGLNESKWRGLAELIGMVSPKSTKLIVPSGTNPSEHKRDVFSYWLQSGYYPSSRLDGCGGSKALTSANISGELMSVLGIRAFGRTQGGKELNASIALAEQKANALRAAPATVPATVPVRKIVLID